MTIGERIRAARRRANLSQKELADKLGVSASMIGQYENDLRNPKLSTLQKISEVLGVHWTCFVDIFTAEAFDSGISDGISIGVDQEKSRHILASALWEQYRRANELSDTEMELIRKFRLLDDRGKSAVLNALEHEHSSLPEN